jgi:hypothetical protein
MCSNYTRRPQRQPTDATRPETHTEETSSSNKLGLFIVKPPAEPLPTQYQITQNKPSQPGQRHGYRHFRVRQSNLSLT